MKKYIPTLILFFLLVCWAVFFDRTTDHFIFEPSRQIYSLQTPFKEISFRTADGHTLYALYHPAQAGKPTLLFFHGSKYNIYTFQDFVLPYAKRGFGIFLFDYRGYGKSEGSPSQQNMYKDSQAALFELMLKQHILPKEIVLWGFALGSSPALYGAATYNKLPFKAVILQSPFTNMADMGFYLLAQKYDGTWGATVLPLFLKPLLWNKNFDNIPLIAQVRAPMLIGFSRLDRTVPWTMSRALAVKAPAGTQQFFSPTGIHDSPEWFEKAALEFLNSLDNSAPAAGDIPAAETAAK